MMLLALAAAVASGRLPPVDECAADRSFVEFRATLRRLVVLRSASGLLAFVADDVQASLGGDVGKPAFVRMWKLQGPTAARSPLWGELGRALRLGCTLGDGTAIVPAMAGQPIGERDAFETRIALPGATLRRAPSRRARTAALLDWHFLTVTGSRHNDQWLKVRLDDGRAGYVRISETRSPIDYRAWFRKRAGRWTMEGFLAGD